jgi:hypothetical protein
MTILLGNDAPRQRFAPSFPKLKLFTEICFEMANVRDCCEKDIVHGLEKSIPQVVKP